MGNAKGNQHSQTGQNDKPDNCQNDIPENSPGI